MTDTERRDNTRINAHRPSALTMITAAAASAAAFYVITKSGIAGTLVGAAVFSAVYHGASHWLGGAAERGASWWLDRRGVKVGERADADGAAPPSDEAPAESGDAAAATAVARTRGGQTPAAASATPRRSVLPVGLQLRRALAVWGPLILALAALGASGYSVVTGEPIERVIIRERVVEKPVVEERVVVQRETVTVTVTVPPRRDATGNETTAPPSTSTTVPPSTATSSTTTPGGVGTGTGPTTSTVPPVTSTTLPPTTVSTDPPPGE